MPSRPADGEKRLATPSLLSDLGLRGKPRVAYWIHSPTPYFVDRFNAVADLGTVDFEVWFNHRREPDRSWSVDEASWRFSARYIPSRTIAGYHAPLPFPELRRFRPDLVVQECDRAHLVAGFLAARAIAARTAFRALPNYDAWSERTWWREAGKHFVYRAVDAAKVPGPDGAAFARRYGLAEARVHRVIQSIDVPRYGEARGIAAGERARLRAALGVAGCVFIYVGRLWQGKGLDDLLAAYGALAADGQDVSLVIVGDGPDEPRYRDLAQGLPRVVFSGFVQAPELPRLYAASDVFVFPTLGDPNGLVIEEAMAAGLPVITSSAAGDVQLRVPHGEAGLVVPPRAPEALRTAMKVLSESAQARAAAGRAAAQLAARFEHARYARDFEQFIAHALAAPVRRTPAAAAARAAGRVLARGAGHQRPAPLVHSASADARGH